MSSRAVDEEGAPAAEVVSILILVEAATAAIDVRYVRTTGSLEAIVNSSLHLFIVSIMHSAPRVFVYGIHRRSAWGAKLSN